MQKHILLFFIVLGFYNANAQKVGIGSTQFTPTNTLDVKGNMSIGANYTGIATTAPTNGLLIEGNVGIGTHTTGYKLDVTGTTEWGIRYLKTGSRDARITVGDPTKSWSHAVGWGTAGDYSIIEEGAAGDRFYIKQGGNVGISTSNPAAKLAVQGGMILDNAGAQGASLAAASSFLFGGATGEGFASARTAVANQYGIDFYTNYTNRLAITNRGWVGIGTTRPGLASTEENSWLNVPAGFKFLTINGAAGAGGLEFTTNFADADLANIGLITFTDRNRTSAGGSTDNRAACIAGYQQGATANRRGGALGFFVLPNNTNSVVTNAMWIDNNAFISFNSTNGSLYSSPKYQLTVYGAGQNTANMTDAGNKSAAILVSDANGFNAGNGGALLLGASSSATNASPWAAIKGIFTANGASAIGDLAFSTRNAVGDASLTERMRITSRGWVGIGTTRPGIGSGNENPWLTVSSTRRFLSINGDGGGGLELTTNEADGDGVSMGILQWVDKNRTSAGGNVENRVACISGYQQGATANRRGGALGFFVAADNSTAVVTNAMWIADNSFVSYNTINGIIYQNPKYQLSVYGIGQNTANLTDAGNKAGAILISDATGFSAGQGGALLFGANNGVAPANVSHWAAIKGVFTSLGASAVGDLAFSTRNAVGDASLTERMRLKSDGTFLIGSTTTPLTSHRLYVSGGHGDSRMVLHSTGGGTAATEGDLVFWTSEPGATWEGCGIGNNWSNVSGGGFARISTSRAGSYIRLLSNGVIINPVTAAGAVVNGIAMDANGQVIIGGGGVAGARLDVGANGDGTVARANAWNNFSDVRWKKDISPITNGLETVKGLQGVNYTWKATDKKDFGFIAQEVEKVLPLAVHTDDKGYKSVDYARITAVLIEGMKEQQKIIDNQQSTINDILENSKQQTIELQKIKALLESKDTKNYTGHLNIK